MMSLESVVLPQPLSPDQAQAFAALDVEADIVDRDLDSRRPAAEARAANLEALGQIAAPAAAAPAASAPAGHGSLRMDHLAGGGGISRKRDQPLARLHVEARHRAQQRLEIGVARDGGRYRPGFRSPSPCRGRCTTTSSATLATTPRSWVIISSAMPSSAWRSLISFRIWAWMVTSSAVVGSSAISRPAGRSAPWRSSRAGASRPESSKG